MQCIDQSFLTDTTEVVSVEVEHLIANSVSLTIPKLIVDMLVLDSPTLADHVVAQLYESILDHGILASSPQSSRNGEQLQEDRELATAWYLTIMYCSRQGSVVPPILTQTELQNLITETANGQLSDSVGTGQSGASRLILHLVELLTHPPDFHWKQQDKEHSPNSASATDAVMVLRSILLILKLVSICQSQEGPAIEGGLVSAILWQVMETLLKHTTTCFDDLPATTLAAAGYGTAKGHANSQQSCQLAAAIIRLVLPLIRMSLKQRVADIKEHFAILKCLLLPQWGLPAVTAKAELFKSGITGKRLTC